MFPVLIYIASIVIANLSVAHFGPSITPINAFLFIGLDLVLRNWIGRTYSPAKMLGLIAFAGCSSYALNPATGRIALASMIAFVLAALSDWATFRTIPGQWFRRCMGGVAVGALVDSLVFPTIAFGSLLPAIVVMQFIAKVSGGALWAWMINKRVAAA